MPKPDCEENKPFLSYTTPDPDQRTDGAVFVRRMLQKHVVWGILGFISSSLLFLAVLLLSRYPRDTATRPQLLPGRSFWPESRYQINDETGQLLKSSSQFPSTQGSLWMTRTGKTLAKSATYFGITSCPVCLLVIVVLFYPLTRRSWRRLCTNPISTKVCFT